MVGDLFSEYYDYKVKCLFDYSLILSKIINIKQNKLFNNQKNKEDFFMFISSLYLRNYFLDKKMNNYLVKAFIDDKDISTYKLSNEAFCVISYLIEKGKILDINLYKEDIILGAFILKIANELDVASSNFQKNENNYATIVNNLINTSNKISFIHLIDDGKKITDYLIELIKINVKKERKLFDTLDNENSFNKYIDISEENKYYLAQYNYRIPSLVKYDPYAIKDVYDKLGVDDNFVLINASYIMVTMMKLLSIRKKMKVFFLPIRISFLENDRNIKNLSLFYNREEIRRYIKVLINYNEYDKDLVKKLDDVNISYYIYCSKTSGVKDGVLIDGCNDYLISRDLSLSSPGVINDLKKTDINMIIEDFDGIVTDDGVLKD